MTVIEYRFIEPLDVLFLRGNKMFGDPGSFGESLLPPWPSIAAGALRSRMLADDGVDLTAFARGDVNHPTLGTPMQPGSFVITAFHLARHRKDGVLEALTAPPADLIVSEGRDGNPIVRVLTPTRLAGELMSSAPFALLPVLVEPERSKPANGYWLNESGWRKYLAGETPGVADLVKSGELWALDHRVGVGLDTATRRAADGRLFSMQAVAMKSGVGFLAAVTGAIPPNNGTVRLGGDGRAATIRSVSLDMPEPDYAAIARSRRCRLILSAPGIFPEGWKLPGTDQDGNFEFGEIRARITCAAVQRADIVSGWNLAKWQPKSAQRVAPAGSVYWLDEIEATPEALRKLAEKGLWSESCEDMQRRAEGFNCIMFAAY
ncbi:CRISPR-associated protein [Ferrovum myxofaciens]|uniref:CRISPR-associated protein n=1 Tax=Ferrovum myxofaciens TaxID=416213 RepID=A0A149VXE9_9PROT|nr:type III-B CRISPR module-associated Cmr3 family protein [Ferrovum myxofaciens]KXW57584.1 CRISPR-associated protein [Ferrovum myxofaciens]